MKEVPPALVVAFLLGAAVGGALGPGSAALSRSPTDSNPGPNPDSPPLSLWSAGPDCASGNTTPNAGWVHDVAVGESFAVTLNATVVHDRNRTVEPDVSRTGPRAYRIDFRTVPVENRSAKEKRLLDRCRLAETEIGLATSLPTNYSRFEVAVNGRTIRTVEYDGTTADLHRLPNPINATAAA
ncbi:MULTISPECIES: hypothetical protein [Halorussus]|uniref:hypothetical protein n=1 Tax=Halorussus TaxID=1070314 RepID=UPI00209EC834|nr:hypothetical protein [Halorussus vallis]USZ76355.1 hypothetical protein NGM07_03265 [Halorussus vallis]